MKEFLVIYWIVGCVTTVLATAGYIQDGVDSN